MCHGEAVVDENEAATRCGDELVVSREDGALLQVWTFGESCGWWAGGRGEEMIKGV